MQPTVQPTFASSHSLRTEGGNYIEFRSTCTFNARGIDQPIFTLQQQHPSMFASGSRIQRITYRTASLCRDTRPQRIPTLTPPPLRLHQIHTQTRTTPPPRTRSARPTRAAIEPLTFAIAFALSAGIAYTVDQYKSYPAHPDPSEETLSQETKHNTDEEVQRYSLVMAPQTPPGRPGNLTADQEAKLKEMWSQLLDLFGVAHESVAHANGTSTPTTTDSSSIKKPKKRMGLFGSKKDTSETNGAADTADNDKHGQNREYQAALASQSPAELRDAFWSNVKMDNPDALLLRFLRARKWDVHAAIVMMISTGHWRKKEVHIDEDIMLKGELGALQESQSSNAAEKKEGEDFMAQLRMGKSFLHGVDKEGRPLCYVRVKLHHGGEQTEKSLERFTVYLIETARLHLRPPVDTATVVFNMTDFSLSNMDYTPVKFMIKCFEANYPESLGSVLVYKSPWVFHSIWKIIKGWLDPVVASKVHFASNVSELEQWIPKSQILKELGGDEDWSYEYVEPAADENRAIGDAEGRARVQGERDEIIRSYESDTVAWLGGDAGKVEARTALAQKLAENYWTLDPFVRARSLYDRIGVVGWGGQLDFYPKPAPAAVATSGGREDELD